MQGHIPHNEVNYLYDQLLGPYSAARDVNKVTDVFSPLYPGFQIGQDFEKVENARMLDPQRIYI